MNQKLIHELINISQTKNKKGTAPKEALIAQKRLYEGHIHVRKRIYDDYSGNLITDNEEIEDFIDITINLQSLSSLYEQN